MDEHKKIPPRGTVNAHLTTEPHEWGWDVRVKLTTLTPKEYSEGRAIAVAWGHITSVLIKHGYDVRLMIDTLPQFWGGDEPPLDLRE
jgi:hypothetical protein